MAVEKVESPRLCETNKHLREQFFLPFGTINQSWHTSSDTINEGETREGK